MEPIIIRRRWRAEWPLLMITGLSGILAYELTYGALTGFPKELFLRAGYVYSDNAQRGLWIIPALLLLTVIWRVYNVRYLVDNYGIETKTGILSWNQLITRIRFEDIRSIEARQNVIEQLLGIGRVAIGTAASSGMEILFLGIKNPMEVQQIIQGERGRREQMNE